MAPDLCDITVGELSHSYSPMTTKRKLPLNKTIIQASWGFREKEEKEAGNSPYAFTWHTTYVLSFSPNHIPSECQDVVNSVSILHLKTEGRRHCRLAWASDLHRRGRI